MQSGPTRLDDACRGGRELQGVRGLREDAARPGLYRAAEAGRARMGKTDCPWWWRPRRRRWGRQRRRRLDRDRPFTTRAASARDRRDERPQEPSPQAGGRGHLLDATVVSLLRRTRSRFTVILGFACLSGCTCVTFGARSTFSAPHPLRRQARPSSRHPTGRSLRFSADTETGALLQGVVVSRALAARPQLCDGG
jgi:hypothetical protein